MAELQSPWVGKTDGSQHCAYCNGEPGYRPILHDADCIWQQLAEANAEVATLRAVLVEVRRNYGFIVPGLDDMLKSALAGTALDKETL